jgi:TRAP-type C4-dicarboxylate transport system permease large subunit
MGLALFLVGDIARVSMKEVLKAMAPYYVPLAITLMLITYVPGITTWIPRWALGN